LNYSPLLSIITVIFEILLILWAFIRGKRNKIIFATCAILLLLSIYQILEVFVCMNPAGSIFFSRLGFLVITWLPALGLLLICFLFPYRSKILLRFVQLMLLSSFILNLWILSDHNFVRGTVCRIVFASYSSPMPQFMIYGAYYQLGLLSMIIWSALGIIKSPEYRGRLKLGQILFGTILFVFPAMMVVIAFPPAKGSLTSALCHFALFLALFLGNLIRLEIKDNKEYNL